MPTRSVLLLYSYLEESSSNWYALPVDISIPVASPPRQSSPIVTQPTSLGVNDTNVAELSQHLQSSLSLGTNKGSPEPNTCLESLPMASHRASTEQKERGNATNAKVPPAVSGGTGPHANTPLERHEYDRNELITPTATWPLERDTKPGSFGCPTQGPACLTQEVKPSEVDNRDDLPKKVQVELENPPTLAYDDEEFRRADDDKEQTLEVIAEIPEDVNTVFGNCQQEAKESSPVQLITEGKKEDNYEYCTNS